nr:hypothetical protein GCM10020241_36440 [Streptoalloteichus tenebrarius]
MLSTGRAGTGGIREADGPGGTGCTGGGTGAGTGAAVSTFTARDTGRPRRRESAAVIGSRSTRSIASLANSLGAASRAVPSSSPIGRVTRIQARCCGDRVPEDNSCTTCSHTRPRSVWWSDTCGLPSPRR